MLKPRRWWWLGAFAVSLAVALCWLCWPNPGDARLKAYVQAPPPVPIVFTSRSEPASFRAAAPAGEGFNYPGQPLWQAREGRLRLLTPRGAVHELTWGKALPDGGTLIDVMSPSLSMDATKILFAGRRGDDHGHFRIYEIGIDGQGLRALTGGPEDPGCTALPPMRYGPDGQSLLPDDERRRVDYDDVDPVFVDTGNSLIAFASSRTPDLGRGHARRSTTIWTMYLHEPARKQPLTANRYNDRWPFELTSNFLAFSMWSRNQEVITADETDIRPYEADKAWATAPLDQWAGSFAQPTGAQIGALVRPHVPVWRCRPLFNGRLIFMTTFAYASFDHDAPHLPAFSVVQADAGLLHSVPSARPIDQPIPAQGNYRLFRGPATDAAGQPLSLATPSPCPPGHVLLAGAPCAADGAGPRPSAYGIYLARDNWEVGLGASGTSALDVGLTLLFDDPDLVDAEPVAAYVRQSKFWRTNPAPPPATDKAPAVELPLANGTTYRGQAGSLFNSALYTTFVSGQPGQQTDIGEGPIFDKPPEDSLHTIRIYASRRDRFDDPVRPRLEGAWELLADAPVSKGSVGARLPAGVPTVLAGFNQAGRVVRWTTAPKDSHGRQATFYAFAGDHYSAVHPLGKHFCTGCHPGHSGLPFGEYSQAEKMAR